MTVSLPSRRERGMRLWIDPAAFWHKIEVSATAGLNRSAVSTSGTATMHIGCHYISEVDSETWGKA